MQQPTNKKSASCKRLTPFIKASSKPVFKDPVDSLDNNKIRNIKNTIATHGIPKAWVPKNGFPCDAPCFRNAIRSFATMLIF
jgi:hypothetical protein